MASKSPCPEAPVTPETMLEPYGAMPSGSATRVTVLGHLVNDPELRGTAAGIPVSRLQLATRGTDGTVVLGVVASHRLAEVAAEHLVKGCRVRVEGYLRGRTWIEQNGAGCYDVDIVATALDSVPARAA